MICFTGCTFNSSVSIISDHGATYKVFNEPTKVFDYVNNRVLITNLKLNYGLFNSPTTVLRWEATRGFESDLSLQLRLEVNSDLINASAVLDAQIKLLVTDFLISPTANMEMIMRLEVVPKSEVTSEKCLTDVESEVMSGGIVTRINRWF